jgi:hypothetical protein
MAIGKTSMWATVQAQNAKRKANFAAARSQSSNTMSSLMSVGASNTSGLVALTEQILRSKAADKLAAAKAEAVKTQQKLSSLDTLA